MFTWGRIVFILTEACSCRLELAYFAGKISKNRLVFKIVVALAYYGSCRLPVMGSCFRRVQLDCLRLSYDCYRTSDCPTTTVPQLTTVLRLLFGWVTTVLWLQNEERLKVDCGTTTVRARYYCLTTTVRLCYDWDTLLGYCWDMIAHAFSTGATLSIFFTIPFLVWIQVWDRLCVPGGAPPAEISNYTRTPPQLVDMVSLQTHARCRYEIRYDRPTRMCMSVRDSTYLKNR